MSSQWYLYKDGQQQGPFSWEELYRQAEAGLFSPADLVWTEGMENWSRADQVKGLVSAPPAAPPGPHSAPQGGPAPSHQQRAAGSHRAATAPRRGRAGLVALITVLVVLLLGGGFFVFNLLLADGAGRIETMLADLTGDEGISASSGLPPEVIIGSWQEEKKTGDAEVFLQFNEDETLIIATSNSNFPEESFWLQFQYRLVEQNGLYIIEKFEPENENWHDSAMRVEILTADRLLIKNVLLGDSSELIRIDNHQLQEALGPLEELVFDQDLPGPVQ